MYSALPRTMALFQCLTQPRAPSCGGTTTSTAFTMLVMPRQPAVAAAPGGVHTLPTGAILNGVKRKFLSHAHPGAAGGEPPE